MIEDRFQDKFELGELLPCSVSELFYFNFKDKDKDYGRKE